MNLVPIDTGGAKAELHGGAEASSGDFASLITGLMSGDTQIVPLLDLGSGGQPAEGDETAADAIDAGTPVPMFEFPSMPASDSASPTAAQEPTQANLSIVGGEAAESDQAGSASVDIPDTFDRALSRNLQTEASLGADTALDPDGLASVHSIARHVAAPASSQPIDGSTPPVTDDTVAVAAPDTPADPLGARVDGPGGRGTGSPPTNSNVGVAATTPDAAPTADVVATPVGRDAEGTPLSTSVRAVGDIEDPNPRLHTRPTPESNSEATPKEPANTRAEVDVETGVTTRPLETGRTVTTVSPTAMVGIARRVEEAIAALATKPDPKIVTLQLDELDGLRLTLALRPDGLHLSSSGDAGLTSEIERALAARGFDLASDERRDDQTSEQDREDGWRPQAPARRSRRSTPSGIRL